MIHTALQRHQEVLEDKGFRAEPLQDGLRFWSDALKTTDHTYNHLLCPDRNTLTPENSYGWRLMQDGQLAAVIALRTFEGHFGEILDMVIPRVQDWPAIEGKKFHMGGLYVWPEYRRRGLAWHLSRMIRHIGMTLFDCEHSIGLEHTDMAEAEMWKYYGYSRCERLGTVTWDAPHEFYITHASRDDVAAAWPEELRALNRMGEQEVVGAV